MFFMFAKSWDMLINIVEKEFCDVSQFDRSNQTRMFNVQFYIVLIVLSLVRRTLQTPELPLAARLCDAGLSHFQCEDGGSTFLKFVIPRSPRSNTNGNGGSVGFVGLRSTFESLFCMQKHNQPPHCSYYHQHPLPRAHNVTQRIITCMSGLRLRLT